MKKKKKLSAVLKSKKFFILLKNHSLYPKYETKLKSLGAVISPFLDKEVNYVLTDTPGCNGKVSLTAETLNILSPSCYSVSPATPVSGDDCCATKKTRTRAEAMLERIPTQTQTASLNPIADAVSWNIPVYSIEFFQKWLDKKLAQFQAANEKTDSRNETNARTFEKKYLKLESVFVRNYRPEFKEVSKWPSIDINTLAGSYPFDTKVLKKSGKKENENKKKEGERMNRTCNKTANDAGYCEICAVHYSDLSQHVASSSHIKFTCDDKNYADIDNCIKTRSVEAFLAAHNSGGSNSQPKETNSNEAMGRNLRKAVSLHLNNNENSTAVTRSLTNAKLLADESLKQPLQVQCNGFTNYHLRKTSTKSDSAIIKSPTYYGSKDLLRESRKSYNSCPDGSAVPSNKESHNQLSPATKEENVHRLRSRKSLFLPSILLGTTAEDGPNKVRAGSSPQTPTSNHFLRSSASPKSCQGHHATRKRLPGAPNSADDDVRKGSVASPGSMKCIEQANASGIYFTRSKLGGSPNDAEGKRHSRGSVSPRDDNRGVGTNGRKRKLSVATSDDEEGGSASASPRNPLSYHTNRKMIKNNVCNNDAAQMNSQKKRLSCEEKFLEDNREYYKVEMLRTKLRSTEFYCNQEINQTVPIADTLKESDMKLEPHDGADDDGSNGPVDDEVIEQQTENGEPVVMRFKKIKQRKSALSLLNLEAENFLFGPPKKMDTDDESDSGPEQNGDDTEMLNDVDHRNSIDGKKTPNAKHSNNPSARRTKGKKRRTHAEVFIHDNLDYYRFEISGSRLRHQNADGTESTASSVKNEPNDKSNDSAPTPSCSMTPAMRQVKVKEESVTDEENDSKLPPKKRGKSRRKNTSEMDKETEQVKPSPASEPTNASSTEKEPEEGATRIENVCCVRSMPAESLHFSFESVPSKEPWYKTFVRYDTCNENYIPVPNTISRFQKISNIKPAPTRSSTTPSAAVAAAAVAANELNLSPLQRRRRRSKLARIIAESKPRKSPRCHASTLAILSSLTNHRRRSRKIHAGAVETRRSQGESRSSSSKHETSETGVANSLTATAPKASASSQANSTLEFEARLKEAVNELAKDVDEHFIEIFSNEDCRDKYLDVVRRQDQRLPNSEHQHTNENATNAEFAHCCMQLDESIFQDQDFLNCYVDGTSDIIVEDMATFMNEAQRSCNSMETALDEDLIIPRSNDLLSRLCRENDNSCNSSDCGASSTCEFLGFADDGRTVSRKRKRKRPNMTGWPQNSTRRRRHIRFADIVQRGANESPSRQSTAGSADTGTDTENVSEADSECTDDDMPLSEIASKKRRRGASSSCDTSSPAPKQPHNTSNERSAGRASSRRTSRAPSRPNSLPHRRRGKRGRRRI